MSPESQPQEPLPSDSQASPQDPMLAPVQALDQPAPELAVAPEEKTHDLKLPEAKVKLKKGAVKTQANNHQVNIAIVATVIIVIVLAVLAVYAYQKK